MRNCQKAENLTPNLETLITPLVVLQILFSSVNCSTLCFRAWLSQQPSRTEWDVWVVMGIIGFVVGMVGFLLHQLIDVIADYRYEFASDLIQGSVQQSRLSSQWVV